MKISDERYNNHFRHMILTGILCGLTHPIEFVINYERAIGEKYEDIPEIEEFCSLVIKEFYSAIFCEEIENITNEMCQKWIDSFYKKGERKQC